MNALILVGGQGLRLRPWTLKEPKPVLPLANRPFIETLFARLARAGVRRAVLSAHHQSAVLRRRVAQSRRFGLKVEVVREPRPLGTGGAIRYAWPDPKKPCLVMNGDVLCDLDLAPFLKDHDRRGPVASLWTFRVPDPRAFGVIESTSKGRITRFVEKPRKGQSSSRSINAGLYAMRPEVLDWIPAGRPVSIEREVFPLMVKAGLFLGAWSKKGKSYWRDIGTPENYLQAHLDILAGRVKLRSPAGKRLWGPIRNEVLAGARSRVHPLARVEKSSLGRDCRIAAGARLRSCVLMDGCRVGENAVIEGAILGPGCVLGEGARVGKGARLAAGARMAAGGKA